MIENTLNCKVLLYAFTIMKSFKNEPTVSKYDEETLFKIGDLSKKANESVATIRYWTKIGLLNVTTTTKSGYQLYAIDQVERCNIIRELQKKRYTLIEIHEKLAG